MRQKLLVFVPQEDGQPSLVSYSLYAYGVKKEKPVYAADHRFLQLSFDANCVVVLFYYFSGFERAYVVTSLNQAKALGKEKSFLPGVEGELLVLFTAIGREFRTLRRTVKLLTAYSEEGVFKLPLSFWFRLCALIQGRKAHKSNIMHLLHTTKEDLDLYERENDLCKKIPV